MNLEAINKWLDEEYGCSYTKLEELHDFYFEKYCDLQQENKKLNGAIQTYNILLKSNIEENKQLKEVIDKAIEYIKENIYSYYDSKGEKYIEETVFERNANPKELLDILKEGKNE